MTEPNTNASSKAERIYADALEGEDLDQALDVEALCRAHPRESSELRRIHDGWVNARVLFAQLGLTQSLPGNLAGEPRTESGPNYGPGGHAPEVLRRLADRRHAFDRYERKEEIARGGQGRILRVSDEDLGCDLAMKLITSHGDEPETGGASQIDPHMLSRFLEEARVTGQLDHPGIVPIHELGLDAEGWPYFTMKLVKGQTLQEIFERIHEGDAEWTVTRALSVLLKSAEAMAYAHNKGVIHRDLKPANVMVGRFGEVYVMDWGLAHIIDGEDKRDIRIQHKAPSSKMFSKQEEISAVHSESLLYTMDGDVVGTPAYMPPEQAAGELAAMGPRSDVYSIGAMLYHLLTGRMPYVDLSSSINSYEVWNRVKKGPPESIQRIAKEVPSELRAICEKAMARKPSERYAGMGAFKEDLRAYLEGRVVKAYQSGAIAELKKWTRRNKGTAAATASALLIAIGGLGSISYLEAKSAAEVRTERDASINVVEFFVDQFENLDPRMARVEDITAKEFLDRAALAITRNVRDDPRVAARLRNAFGTIYGSLGLYEQSEELLERAASDRMSLFGPAHPDTLQARNDLAHIYLAQSRHADAERIYQEVLAAGRAAHGSQHPQVLEAVDGLGRVYLGQGLYDQAEEVLEANLEARRLVLGEDHHESLASMESLGAVYETQARYGEAEVLFRECMEKRRDLLGADHPDTLRSVTQLAMLNGLQGRHEEAQSLLLESYERSRVVLGEHHHSTLNLRNDLAAIYQVQGYRDAAEPLYIESLGKLRSLLGDNHVDTLDTLRNLAVLFDVQGRYADAEPLYEECYERNRVSRGENHPNTIGAQADLAVLYLQLGRLEEAEPMLTACLEKQRGMLGASHPDVLTTLYALGSLYRSQGHYAAAEPLLVECYEKRKEKLGEEHANTILALSGLAAVTLELGRGNEAAPLFEQCLKVATATQGRRHPDTLIALNNLALLYQNQNRHKEAEPLLVECLEIRREVLGVDHPETLTTLNSLGVTVGELGRLVEAEALLKECLAKRSEALGVDHPHTLMALDNMAWAISQQGRFEEAEALYIDCVDRALASLGEENPMTLRAMNNFARVLERQGDHRRAEPLLLTCLQHRRELLGASAGATEQTFRELTTCYDAWLAENRAAGKGSDAETLSLLLRLGTHYEAAGNFASAERYYEQCMEQRLDILGPEHTDYHAALDALADLYLRLERETEAEPLLGEVLELRREILGVGDPTTLSSEERLVGLYSQQGRWDEAETLARQLLEATPGNSAAYGAREQLLARTVEALGTND